MSLPFHNPTSVVPQLRAADLTGKRRSGLTLIELMVASTIMAITVAALAVLAHAVQSGAEYGNGHGQAVQHARVTFERITRLANEATTSPQFPGLLVVATNQAGNLYPDTLVVWHPSGVPSDPEGLPRFSELVIFCPRAGHPNELIELTAPSDTRTVPMYKNQALWFTEIEALKSSTTTRQVNLTNLVRTASTDDTAPEDSRRACVRFNVRLRPSDANLAAYEANTVDWDELPWVQNVYSPSLGLRQVWLRIELQLMPGGGDQANNTSTKTAIPFFDSAAVYYSVKR
ncbi:MAG: prepilin-type N-terminal cleavage/methylation domain-containing protein [Pirellulales bacterium]|nr:prepilin-type N-terminal cleavage/methylation domain-containing protein [Pirellulales bacterium]